jgi:catechol 2,3-dioxygenase-like lactoylglutathione lyase family enzyme
MLEVDDPYKTNCTGQRPIRRCGMLKFNGLDHLSVRTQDVERTAEFFAKVLDMKPGPRPPFKFPGCWLYQDLDDEPLIHVIGVDATADDYLGERDINTDNTGALDHIAFKVQDYNAMKQRLSGYGIEFVERQVPETGVRQLFVTDPHNITLELIFQPDDPSG